MKKNLKNKKGFTLIELIIVIAILGILAAIAIPKFGSAQKDAKIKADISTAKTIADTTAMLVAKGKINLSGTDKTLDTDEIALVVAKLQGGVLPTPQYKKKKDNVDVSFVIKSDEEGNITVFVKPGIGTATETEVYPKHDEYK